MATPIPTNAVAKNLLLLHSLHLLFRDAMSASVHVDNDDADADADADDDAGYGHTRWWTKVTNACTNQPAHQQQFRSTRKRDINHG